VEWKTEKNQIVWIPFPLIGDIVEKSTSMFAVLKDDNVMREK
jgi:hypothetical protein